MDEANTIEQGRHSRLNQARNAFKINKEVAGVASGNPVAILSFSKRLSKHWPIIAVAILFDLFGMIPLIGVVFNFCFGGILYFYFGSKSSQQSDTSKILGIIFPIAVGSAFDFVFSVIPVNLVTAFIRIAFKEIG